MNTIQLMILRSYNFTIGRVPWFNSFVRKAMIYFLIKRVKEKYVASSRYFDYKKFEKEDKTA